MDKKPSIFDSPLMADYHRTINRFLGIRQTSNGSAVALLFFVGGLYLILLLIVMQFASYMETRILINVQNLIFCFSIPSVMHGLIATEREKRSWDVLATTPLTNREIIWGKFFAGLLTQWVTIALMTLPVVIVAIASKESRITNTLAEEVVSIGFAFALASVCLAVSAFCQRAYTAQLICNALLITWLIVVPVFVGLIASGSSSDWLMVGHPFTMTHMIAEKRTIFDGSVSTVKEGMDGLVVVVSVAIYAGITAAVLLIVPKKLKASESDSPRRDSHA